MMKFTYLIIAITAALFFSSSCEEDDTRNQGLALTGRILTDCETKSIIKGVELQLWKDERLDKGVIIPESLVAKTTTGSDGSFSFIQPWDTFPMSLRIKRNNQTLVVSQGIFGNYALQNTYNSSVADLLLNGNNANVLFEIFRPNNWKAGDSAVLKINAPNVSSTYQKVIYDIPGTLLDTVMNVKAYNRIMQQQSNRTELDRRFSFEAQITWVLNGVSETRTYIVPSTTCSKDFLVYPIHY